MTPKLTERIGAENSGFAAASCSYYFWKRQSFRTQRNGVRNLNKTSVKSVLSALSAFKKPFDTFTLLWCFFL